MAGRGGAKSGGKSPGSVSVSGSKGLVGLFPAEDSDEEVVVTPTTARKASPSPAAQADWSLFPGKEEDFGQTAAPEAPAGGKKSEKHPKSGIARLLSQSPRPGSNPASPNMTRGGDYVFPSPGSDKRKKKSKSTSNEKNPDQDNKHDSHKKHGHEYQQSNKGASPLHAGIHDEGGEYNDLEAARPSPLSRSAVPVGMEASEAASDDFELNKDRSPAAWMRVRDTTGRPFLWYTVLLQIAIACCSIVFLASHEENQLSWKTGCWGSWTSLTDANGVEFVEFDTNIGWQLFGKGDNLGNLSEVSERAAIVGGLAGGMHTLMVFVTCGFFFFSLSALWLSHDDRCCSSSSVEPSGKTTFGEERAEPIKPSKRDNPLELARDCHRWMFVMAVIDVFAGLWCFGVGCAGFYAVVTRDVTDGLEDIVSEWGDDVTCATAQTSPLYGFFINGLSVFLFFGGGVISFYMTYTADRDLGEAVEMWKNDRAEMAEMASRKAMIDKKEAYAARAAHAAKSVAHTPVSIFKRKSASSSPATVTGKEADEDEGGGGGTANKNVVLSAVDLDSGDDEAGKNGTTTDSKSGVAVPASRSVLESPRRQRKSPGPKGADWDLESGSEAAAAGAAAARGGGVTMGKDHLPPPEGWEVRSTPSGDTFWVNLVTKNVSWEPPTE